MVGAGVAGLAAAARLASGGRSVTVCERTGRAGGALGTWEHDGLVFDTGAYTLTLPAVYRDLFLKTGPRARGASSALEDRVDLRPLDPVRRYLFPDGTRLDLPNASRARLAAGFDEVLGTGAGEDWLRVVDHGNRVWAAIRPALVEAPGSGPARLAGLLRTAEGRRALTPGRTLRGLGRRWFGDPRLGLLLDDYARQAGADPHRAPGVLAALPYIEHTFGAWQVAGGLGTLAAALYERARARGARFRFDAEVVRIGTGSGAADGVVLADGETLAADLVVADVDAAVLARLTGRPVPKPRYSPAPLTLCLGVDDPPAMAHETVLLAQAGPALRVHVPRERPGAWTVHADARQSPDEVLAELARRGFDVRDRLSVRHVITPADRAGQTGAPGGAPYGPAPDSLRSALLRSPVAQRTAGLYHVGGSARPGAGLAFAALSGWHAAELIAPRGG